MEEEDRYKVIITFSCPLYLAEWLAKEADKTGNKSQVIVKAVIEYREKEDREKKAGGE